MGKNQLQGSLFEEDYLLRTLGSIAHSSDVALTELVANAWDAGATNVRITIPAEKGRDLVVEDDGTGMTVDQFKHRWMTLAYDRHKHQGDFAEFPPERATLKRRAFGRNGVGRHGMLCFADRYVVETRAATEPGARFTVATTSGKDPFAILSEEPLRRRGHGTRLIASVVRNLPDADKIKHILAARFIYDPQFTLSVNELSVPVQDHKGLIHRRVLRIAPGVSAEAFCVASSERGRTSQQHGVAFWVGKRLVGEPSWTLGSKLLLDGRTTAARSLTVVVQLEAMFEEVEPDWSRFKKTPLVDKLYDAVSLYVEEVTREYMAAQVQETTESAIESNLEAFERLTPLARSEVAEFASSVAADQPTIPHEMLTATVRAVIRLEETRSGKMLLNKLAKLSPDDVSGLNKLLDDWSVRDALTVLDEISKRISLVEALEKLEADKTVDELGTLHPMVTQARWLFGPEFESAFYVANISVRRALEEILKTRIDASTLLAPKGRPDILMLPDSTLSAVATDELIEGTPQLSRILIIELKRGGFTIGRDEMHQAAGYIEDLVASGKLDGAPYIQAFVVGHEINPKVQRTNRIGDPERGRVDAWTFGQVVRIANARLFRLREQVAQRYEGLGTDALLKKLKKQGRLRFDDPKT